VKKKWRENGRRAFFTGSNPHSKGLDFSRLFKVRKLRSQAAKNTIKGIASAKRSENRVGSISHKKIIFWVEPNAWESSMRVKRFYRFKIIFQVKSSFCSSSMRW
jgi:hypothetical protein